MAQLEDLVVLSVPPTFAAYERKWGARIRRETFS